MYLTDWCAQYTHYIGIWDSMSVIIFDLDIYIFCGLNIYFAFSLHQIQVNYILHAKN